MVEEKAINELINTVYSEKMELIHTYLYVFYKKIGANINPGYLKWDEQMAELKDLKDDLQEGKVYKDELVLLSFIYGVEKILSRHKIEYHQVVIQEIMLDFYNYKYCHPTNF